MPGIDNGIGIAGIIHDGRSITTGGEEENITDAILTEDELFYITTEDGLFYLQLVEPS